MATHSSPSTLFECLFITLLLSLSFTSCHATSRGMESMAAADPMASTSCRGRDCPATTTEQYHQGMMRSKWTQMSSVDSVAAEAKISDPQMSTDHDDSEWVRGSEQKTIMDSEHLTDSDMEGEDWTMRDPAHKMSDTERMRDFKSEGSNMDSTRGGDSNKLRDSEKMPSNYMESQRLENTHRMRESDRMMGRMRDSERLIDSHRMRDSRGMIHSDRMRDSHRMIDSNTMRDSERIRDSDGMRDSHTMIDSDGMRGSHGMRDSHRMRVSDRARDSHGMMDSDRISDSHWMMDSDRMRDSHQMTNSNPMRDSEHHVRNSDRRSADLQGANSQESKMMQDTDRMRASEGRRDLESNTGEADNMVNSAAAERRTHLDGEKNRGSEMMGDADQMRNLNSWRRDSNMVRNSDSMHEDSSERMSTHSHDGMRHSDADHSRVGHMVRQQSSNMEPSSCPGANCRSTSDLMGDADQMRNLKNRRDSNLVRNSDSMHEDSSERMSTYSHDGMKHSDSDHSRMGHMVRQQSSNMEPSSCPGANCRSTSDLLGDADQMRNLNNRRRDSDMMRNSDSMQEESSEQMGTYSHDGMRHSDTDHSRMGHMEKQQSSTTEPRSCHGTKCLSTSDLIEDSAPMRTLNRRGDLERRSDSAMMTNSYKMHESSDRMNTISHRMRSLDVADHSRMGSHTERQHSSTMEPSSCHGTNCRSTSDAEAMQLGPRRLDAEIIGSRSNKDSERINSSTAAERCSEMNTAHCDGAQIDGELRGSQKMDHMSEREGLSSSCRLKGADCHVTPNGELQDSQKVDHVSEREGLPNSCRFNGADCHVTPDRATSNPQPTRSGRMTSCSDEHCSQSIANSEETMARLANSDRMHTTRNDREIVQPPKWMKLERTTATTTDTTRMGNSDKTSPMAHQDTTRADSQQRGSSDSDSETMHVTRERDLGSVDDAEKKSSFMRGSEMVHDSTSNHRSTNAEINHPSSCTGEANCQRTSEIVHMSSRDSEMMGHGDESEMTHTGSKKSLENRDLTMDQMDTSAEMRSNSQMMRNPEETNADGLHMIHPRN